MPPHHLISLVFSVFLPFVLNFSSLSVLFLLFPNPRKQVKDFHWLSLDWLTLLCTAEQTKNISKPKSPLQTGCNTVQTLLQLLSCDIKAPGFNSPLSCEVLSKLIIQITVLFFSPGFRCIFSQIYLWRAGVWTVFGKNWCGSKEAELSSESQIWVQVKWLDGKASLWVYLLGLVQPILKIWNSCAIIWNQKSQPTFVVVNVSKVFKRSGGVSFCLIYQLMQMWVCLLKMSAWTTGLQMFWSCSGYKWLHFLSLAFC